MKSELDSYIEASIQTKDRIINDLEIKRAIVSLSSATLETLQKGGKVIFCGNKSEGKKIIDMKIIPEKNKNENKKFLIIFR